MYKGIKTPDVSNHTQSVFSPLGGQILLGEPIVPGSDNRLSNLDWLPPLLCPVLCPETNSVL